MARAAISAHDAHEAWLDAAPVDADRLEAVWLRLKSELRYHVGRWLHG